MDERAKLPAAAAGTLPRPVPVRLWRRGSLRWQFAAGFALPLLIVALASLLAWRVLQESSDRTEAASEAIAHVEAQRLLLGSVLDAETHLRGYLLTSNRLFLADHHASAAAVQAQVAQLRGGTDGDGEPVLAQVADVFARWRRDFAEPAIALRAAAPAGLEVALEAQIEMLQRAGGAAELGKVGEGLRAVASRHPPWEGSAALERMAAALGSPGADPAAALDQLQALQSSVRTQRAQLIELIQSLRGKQMIDRIRAGIGAQIAAGLTRQQRATALAERAATRAALIALVAPGVAVLLALSLLMVIAYEVVGSIRVATRGADAVSRGQLDKRLHLRRSDEIGQLFEAFNRMADELTSRRRRDELVDRFQELLLTSDNSDEIHEVLARFGPALFPGHAGALAVISASRNVAEHVTGWEWPDVADAVFAPSECRALRAGKAYRAAPESQAPWCPHLGSQRGRETLCLPLSAQDEVIGVLSLVRLEPGATATDQRLASLVAEHAALALSNLRLREALRNQSIRDPLTGLFNRRYLEETLQRELSRARRQDQSVAVIAIDADNFKRVNDTWGHEAGDAVLVALAEVLAANVRAFDIACRFGGEEFFLLMPQSDARLARERAEQVLAGVRQLSVVHRHDRIAQLTVSAGVAAFPEHAHEGDALLRAADAALYAAKRAGRDRVVVAGPPLPA